MHQSPSPKPTLTHSLAGTRARTAAILGAVLAPILALGFGGGAVDSYLRGRIDATRLTLGVSIACVLLVLAVLSAAAARRRVIVAPFGLTVVRAWSTREFRWRDIDYLGVDRSTRRWLIRIQVDGEDLVAFRNPLIEYKPYNIGANLRADLIYGPVPPNDDPHAPPQWAPAEFRTVYGVLHQYWVSYRDTVTIRPRRTTPTAAPPTPEPELVRPSVVSTEPPTERHHLRDWRHWARGVLGGFALVAVLVGCSAPVAIAEHSAGYFLRPALALIILIVIAISQLRNGTVIDPHRLSAVAAFRRHDLSWDSITRVDLERSWEQWLIRAWRGSEPIVVFHLHPTGPLGRTRRSRPGSPVVGYERPPRDAPDKVIEAFALIENYLHHYGQPSRPERREHDLDRSTKDEFREPPYSPGRHVVVPARNPAASIVTADMVPPIPPRPRALVVGLWLLVVAGSAGVVGGVGQAIAWSVNPRPGVVTMTPLITGVLILGLIVIGVPTGVLAYLVWRGSDIARTVVVLGASVLMLRVLVVAAEAVVQLTHDGALRADFAGMASLDFSSPLGGGFSVAVWTATAVLVPFCMRSSRHWTRRTAAIRSVTRRLERGETVAFMPPRVYDS